MKKRFRQCDLDLDQAPNLTPEMVRDALVECFLEAQGDVLRQTMQRLGVPPTPERLREKVRSIVRTSFRQTGGDFEHPTASSIRKAMEYMATKAASWGTPQDIIEHHMGEFERALARLEGKE